jgi:hypothetical protein
MHLFSANFSLYTVVCFTPAPTSYFMKIPEEYHVLFVLAPGLHPATFISQKANSAIMAISLFSVIVFLFSVCNKNKNFTQFSWFPYLYFFSRK